MILSAGGISLLSPDACVIRLRKGWKPGAACLCLLALPYPLVHLHVYTCGWCAELPRLLPPRPSWLPSLRLRNFPRDLRRGAVCALLPRRNFPRDLRWGTLCALLPHRASKGSVTHG